MSITRRLPADPLVEPSTIDPEFRKRLMSIRIESDTPCTDKCGFAPLWGLTPTGNDNGDHEGEFLYTLICGRCGRAGGTYRHLSDEDEAREEWRKETAELDHVANRCVAIK